MFKSKNKPDLPARPKPPTWEQMEEDLNSSTKKDIIFTIRNKNGILALEERVLRFYSTHLSYADFNGNVHVFPRFRCLHKCLCKKGHQVQNIEAI